MKALSSILLFLLMAYSGHALIDTASAGNWSSSGIWQSGTAPASGDTLVIPSGVTVNVNCNCGTYSNMYIMVFGTLNFPNGKKINLSANGRVDIFTGGTLTGGNGGSKLNIGGTTVWDGNDADIVGPSSCLSSGCASNPTLPVELLTFSVNASFDNLIEVEWSTATEKQNDYFTLFTSPDHLKWVWLAEVKGQGNTIERSDYSYEFYAQEIEKPLYVRLIQTDFDGTEEIISEGQVDYWNLEKRPNLVNPNFGAISILSYGAHIDMVRVFDDSGAEVNGKLLKMSDRIEMQGLTPGIYLIQCQVDGAPLTLKAMVL